jgi:hypothetical protein
MSCELIRFDARLFSYPEIISGTPQFEYIDIGFPLCGEQLV